MFTSANPRRAVALLAVAAFVMAATQVRAAAPRGKDSTAPNEARLLGVLGSGTQAEKALACKQLAIYGTKDAVPALAPLLLDKELASWARIALEAIPGPAATDALRDAMGKAQGRLLIGVINSVAVRRDAKAVDALVQKLKESDAEVVASAGAALGRIGGDRAADVLEQSLAGQTPALRAAAAEGCILCAEGFLAGGNCERAMKLYDAVRKADVAKQRVLEATRGAILARQSAGVPLLVEQLRSADKAFLAIGLRAARELRCQEVHEMLIAELGKAAPDRQGQLILVLADRAEAGSLSVMLQAAKSGPKSVRIAAVGALEGMGNASCVPVLLDAAVDADVELSQAAKTTLARLHGKEVEAELLARLQQASAKALQVLIELAAQRRIEGSFPVIMRSVEDADAGVRTAAVEAIGAIGEDKQAADLVKLIQKNRDPRERDNIAKALLTLTGRCGASCVPHLLPLAQSGDASLRTVCLSSLAVAGGLDALAAVQSALDDKEEAVRDEAMRTLSTWPNRWPDDAAVTAPLLAMAKSPKKELYKVLALRGYLGYLQGARKLNNDQKLAGIKEVLPLLARPEEKRLAISVLGAMGGSAAMDLLVSFAADTTVVEEACVAIVNNKQLQRLPKEQARKALQTVVDKSAAAATKRKAQEALKNIQ
jgi:HEAT repeat protein